MGEPTSLGLVITFVVAKDGCGYYQCLLLLAVETKLTRAHNKEPLIQNNHCRTKGRSQCRAKQLGWEKIEKEV